jgi:Arc/MetJ-type ribon-helix-helix transcriptional regulator
MNITLSPEVERRVEELVQRGTYPSANALVEDALGSFLDIESQEDLVAILQRLVVAEAEIDRGEFEGVRRQECRETSGGRPGSGTREAAKRSIPVSVRSKKYWDSSSPSAPQK